MTHQELAGWVLWIRLRLQAFGGVDAIKILIYSFGNGKSPPLPQKLPVFDITS
jgi:hypothetical protein